MFRGDPNQLDFWLRLKRLYRPLKTFLQQPSRPTAVIIILTRLLDPGFGDLEAVTRNRFQRVFGANAFAAQRFGQNRQPVRDRQRRPQERQVPYLYRAVITSGEEPLPVWTKLGTANLGIVMKGLGDQVSAEGVPYAGGAVGAGRGEESPVRPPLDKPDFARVAHRRGKQLAGGSVPNASGPKFG